MKGGYTGWGLWDDDGLQPREGRNTGRRVETVRVATVCDDGMEATRAVTGRLTQTWGL